MRINTLKSKRFVKKFSLSALVFCALLALTAVLGTSITMLLWAVDNPTDTGDLVASVFLSATILMSMIGLFVFFMRKNRRPTLRLVRKLLIAMLPLVFLALLFTTLTIAQLDDREIEFNTNDGLTGDQDYFEGLSFSNEKLWVATNEERSKNNMSALTLNAQLNDSALRKCQDMVAKNYWSHNDPEGNEPWHFIDQVNYSYETAGENLAYGFISENNVVTGWMNSEGHRKNILGDYSEVGFGTCKSDNYVNNGRQLIVVQHLSIPTTAKQNQPVAPQNSPAQPAPKPYVASVCTKTPIPHQIRYEDVSYLYVGETRDYGGGMDGYTETCTADSYGYKPPDYTLKPYDKTIYRGTKPLPTP